MELKVIEYSGGTLCQCSSVRLSCIVSVRTQHFDRLFLAYHHLEQNICAYQQVPKYQ